MNGQNNIKRAGISAELIGQYGIMHYQINWADAGHFLSFFFQKILRGCIGILFFTINAAYSQSTQSPVFAFLDSSDFIIGDKIVLHIGVDYTEKDKLVNTTPDMPFDTATMEILDKGVWGHGGRGRDWGVHKDIVFTVWDTGFYQIPSIVFTIQHPNNYVSTHATKPVLFSVKNPKGVDAMTAPVKIKDIEQEEMTFADYGVYIGALILLPILVYALWYIYRKKKDKPQPIVIEPKVYESPYSKATRLLKELKIKQLWEKGDVKLYYSELSHILRGYFEESLAVPALENTTDEVMAHLRKDLKIMHHDDSKLLLEKIQSLLEMSDLVKFAKATPFEEDNLRYWREAMEIVEQTSSNAVENKPDTA